MATTGFSLNTKDFDIKFARITGKTIPRATERAVFKTAALVLRDAIKEEPAVPKSRGVTKEGGRRGQGPGHLRRSQKIEKPKVEHGAISVELGFNADYAAYVHEAPRSWLWTTPGTGPKFLESKLIRNKEKYMANVAKEIKEAGGK